MSSGRVLTPLRSEWLAVSRLLSQPAIRSGRSRGASSDGPVLVAGVAGALAPELRAGDFVVASAVLTPSGERTDLPVAPLLAGALRRAGLDAHIGPVVTTERIVDDPAGRALLAESGAVAVDTESALLVAGAPTGQAAVVRAIVDTPEARLLRPGMLVRGVGALAALRRAAPVLDAWQRATGPREVVLASPRSFCAGVERAIEIVDRSLERFGSPVYVRRQIVHNRHVVAALEGKGAVFVDEVEEVPEGATVVLAAHGVAPTVRRDAVDRGLQVVDATCPLVSKVHTEVRRFAGQGYTVFLIGHADHEEVVGTLGESPEHVVVVSDAEAARTVRAADPDKVSYVMQTTLAVEDAERTAAVLRERFPALRAPRRDDICYATSNRQDAVREVARGADVVIVLGSTNSSNSQRLVEVAAAEGTPAHLVDDLAEVELSWLAGTRRVGLTAGASAPPRLVDEVVAGLSGLGHVEVREAHVASENVRFTLPREVG
ncbi:4-hydroxy-3-methylbut-2-enyl diphosphate reductase [Nocardioides sp. CER19]|uniref:4-hydroxy-3-methylbut-2-enyl diphosphate reductase n=1 Tax=Nocardioides sp. CER19 TaxID=3038538 RepID=UPI00244CDB41|nr:4-hydroxy-3-methylbut-2-enyl diphosphate reductase [Nocardioides sp. CER19]MDH2414482.1 4-hydroxy-3-methylbut-2-enyl diphosphate reductase [Nocardioides sp. CER19]